MNAIDAVRPDEIREKGKDHKELVAQIVGKKVESWRWRNRTSTSQETVDKVPAFEVRVLFDSSDPKLKPGMTAQARIIMEEIPDVVYVSIGTVFEDAEGSTIVFYQTELPEPDTG